MNIRIAVVALSGAALLLPSMAVAQTRRAARGAGTTQVGVQPFHFGLGALATWARDAGEPSTPFTFRERARFGLLLQKLTATASFAASGATLLEGTLPAENLTALGFDISGLPGIPFGTANGYCGGGAPRFNVVSDAGTCFLGCASGDKTQDTASGWWTISFQPPFTQYAGCAGVTGSVTSIEIVFDEGTDIGPGSVVLDNIRVNNRVFGKPPGFFTE